MSYGKRSSRQRPHDAVSSSRVPSVAREHPVPCRPLRPEPQDGSQVARSRYADAPMGPTVPKSTVLTPAEEAIVVAFRQKTLLPLDDVLGCLRDTIPNLSRSALHRCLQRHGISRLPVKETKNPRKRFKTYEIGYVHIDSCELRAAPRRRRADHVPGHRPGHQVHLREFHDKAGKMAGAAFLRAVIEVFPYKIHIVLTDNGMAFADPPKYRDSPTHGSPGGHISGRVCLDKGIEHRLTSIVSKPSWMGCSRSPPISPMISERRWVGCAKIWNRCLTSSMQRSWNGRSKMRSHRSTTSWPPFTP
jgi:hypothetical protein